MPPAGITVILKRMTLCPVGRDSVPGSNNLFQSGFWARFKESAGQESFTFTARAGEIAFPLVAILRKGPSGDRYAYVPRGPDHDPGEAGRGTFMEELALALRPSLPADVAAVRFDTVFPSPFLGPEFYTSKGQWKGAPRAEVRELRMNWGTVRHALRKSVHDHMSPDTVIIDLRESEETLLARMRQTTRNSVRRAWKSGAEFRQRDVSWLPEWYAIYADTVKRKGFYGEGPGYFRRLFDLASASGGRREGEPEFLVLSAEKDGRAIAGIVLALYGTQAYYLYAGSTLEMRECMPNYGLQWEAILAAKAAGCERYDLLGVPPNGDPRHSQYGLYTFKTGLGGAVAHWTGCWDFPYDGRAYERLRNAENLA